MRYYSGDAVVATAVAHGATAVATTVRSTAVAKNATARPVVQEGLYHQITTRL